MSSNNTTLDDGITIGCGCAACQNGNVQNSPETQTDTQSAPGAAASAQTIANYIIYQGGSTERSWDITNISFSISNGYTLAEKINIRIAFDLWEDLSGLTFNEVASNGDIDLVVGNDGRAYASTTYTIGGSVEVIQSSTVSIDTSTTSWDGIATIGDYGFTTVLHEVAHALGMGHSGDYNGSANYNTDAFWVNDTHQMTVMSYFSANNIGSDHWNEFNTWTYPASPMLADIVAIQQLYGANYTTRNGNTVYGFNSTADQSIYDFSIAQTPLAIWDGGGIDTLNLSGYNQDQIIYLTEGDYSSTGFMTNNLVIAYGTVIENATGGTGNDIIYGNDANNIILGGGGNDTLFGSIGDDTLNGNSGNDTVSYTYAANEFAFNFIDNVTVALQHVAQNFLDTIYNVENFIFAGINYTFTELEANFGDLEIIGFRAFWSGGGKFAYNSDDNETKIFDATEMNYADATGDQFTIVRNFYETTITVNNTQAAPTITLYGSTQSDTILVNGTHNGLSTKIFAGNGNDIITVLVTGNDRVYGDAGNDVIDSGAGNDILYGGTGNDTLNGGTGVDRLYGMDDDDVLNGGDDNDSLYGGDGTDTLNGGNANDLLKGGNGNDILNGDAGDDRVYGDAGDDEINGGAGYDKLYGGDGIDTINGGSENDYIYGMDGDDILNGDDGNDAIYGGNNDDTISGGLGNDKLVGENGNDTINGDDGKDHIYGNAGDDILNGGAGQDTLIGGADNDTLNGDEGNDYLYGQNGDDILNGGIGHDTLYGDNDNDTLNGGDGIDRLIGGAGNDILNGGNDDDTLYGGTGTDILIGGAGVDVLYGQQGSDTFGFTALDGSSDQIKDFTLNGVEADALNITDILIGFNGGSDINDFVVFSFKNSDRTDLFINADGIGNDFQQIATIRGADFSGLTAQDLVDSNQLITNSTLL